MIPLARGIMSGEHPHTCNVSTDDLIRTCAYFAEPYFIGMRAGKAEAELRRCAPASRPSASRDGRNRARAKHDSQWIGIGNPLITVKA